MIETTPEGLFKSAAIRGVYPKFFKRVLEYNEMTPDGIQT